MADDQRDQQYRERIQQLELLAAKAEVRQEAQDSLIAELRGRLPAHTGKQPVGSEQND